MGDHFATCFPNSGRIVLSQISSASAIPLAALLLLGLPDNSSGSLHGLVMFIMGLSISWNGPATNKQLLEMLLNNCGEPVHRQVIDNGLLPILVKIVKKKKRRLITHANAKSKSEKFPPPHQDGALGFPLGCSNHMEPSFEPPDPSSFSTVFPYKKSTVPTWSGPLANSTAGNQKRKHKSGRSSKQPATAHARLYTSFHA
ncbi:hypothetical protein ZEAMMB73_Zm00001d052349 [Zea mays]|uniref:Uncharacterized protein n=1 Tax=Zea mays TaxID=4577 RepID=A0A1D6QGK1_MAIZE|nr:hypothetical protein ZEAMMB73_Zm00001d052349 [Zea mays]